MPVSSFFGLQTSLRGLLAAQRSLDTTAHNIANAQTPGYSRQEALLTASSPLLIHGAGTPDGSGAHLGTGVEVSSYRRIRDTFLDLQHRAQSMQLSGRETNTRALEQVELSLAEPGDNGLAAQLDKLWSAWADFANSPDSGAARQALIGQARTVVDRINQLDSALTQTQGQAQAEYDALMADGGELHQLARELAATNGAIRDAERTGATPNDLYDRRDLLLDKVAKLAQVSVGDDGAGSLTITVGGAATPLVDGTTVTWPAPAMPAPGGRLGALAELASATGLPATYRGELTAMAQQLADQVNSIYAPAAGHDFFTYDGATSTLAMHTAVTADTLVAGTGGVGNDVALAISETRTLDGGADELYTQLVTRIGNDVREARRQESNARVLTEALEDRRQSVMGVSLDEEMTNLVRFQRGYQAAARAMTTTDQMLDTLINRTGRVGL